MFKSQIGVFIENSKYYPSDIFRELEEDEYTTQILLMKWVQEIDKISDKKHNEYMKFFETIRDLLIDNLIEKKADLKEIMEHNEIMQDSINILYALSKVNDKQHVEYDKKLNIRRA